MKTWDPSTGLPFQVPGSPPAGLQGPRMGEEEFTHALLLLEGFVRIPKNGPPRRAYFDLVKYSLGPSEWRQAVVESIRVGVSRMPSPAEMIDRAGVQLRESDDAHAGKWIFYCADCGYRFITREPGPEAPELCGACRPKEERWR